MIDIIHFIGIPYENIGRNFSGVDCYGLVYLFYKYNRKIELGKYVEGYKDACNKDEADRQISKYRDDRWNKTENPEYGDVILFSDHGLLNHVGIYLNEKNFLHVYKGSTSHVAELKDYKKRIEGYYEYIQN